MIYYHRNISDYYRKAGRLTMLEHGALSILLDACYEFEAYPVSEAQAVDWAGAKSEEEVAAVLLVLSRFFKWDGRAFVQARVQKEIHAYEEAKRSHWGRSLTSAQRAAIQAARNAAKANAAPKWLTAQDRRDIEAIYQQARDLSASTGVPHEVDHIVPLRGKTVCGLHVSWNLRAIPAHENRAKSNAWEVA